MAIYVTGDTHANLDEKRSEFIQSLSSSDILIVLGDFGYTWTPSILDNYHAPCITLAVDGNHDNFSYLNGCPAIEKYGSSVQVIKENVYRLITGNIYTIEDLRFFIFGGATSLDKGRRLPYVSWWPEEVPSKSDFDRALTNLEHSQWSFDYFLSHTCSEQTSLDFFNYPNKFYDPVERMISELEHSIRSNNPDANYLHLFGHHHENIVATKKICLYEKIVKLDRKGVNFL